MPGAWQMPPNETTVSSPERSPSDSSAAPRRVRVLIVDTAIAFGGSLVVARNLLRHLDSNLIEASLVSACSDGFVSHDFAGNVEIRLLAPRVDYVTLQNWKRSIRRRFHWAPMGRSLEFGAMAVEILANIPYLLRLAHLYRTMSIDVVHANNYSMEPLRAARLLKIPIVYHLHGFLSPPIDRSGRRNFQRVETFVSISRVVTNAAVRAGIDRARIRDIPNFVGRTPDNTPPAMPTELAIGIFGRVTNWKGQKEFLRAALQVLQRFPTLKVYVVGDASDGDPKYFDECRAIARSSAFADQIEFTGLVTGVAIYYRKCTVVVHASIEPEPFGMVLIEAMAEGRPVVASTLGATSEIIDDGVEGYLVNPKDSNAMAERISTLLADPSLATEMGLRGHRKVIAHFNPTVAARRFESVYTEVAQTKTPSTSERKHDAQTS